LTENCVIHLNLLARAQTSVSLPPRAAHTQLSRLPFGIDGRFAAPATDIPDVSTSFTATARNSAVYSPFGIRSILGLQIVNLHDPSDSGWFSLPDILKKVQMRSQSSLLRVTQLA